MTEFSFSDLLRPGMAAQQALTRCLESKALERPYGLGDYLMHYGERFMGRPLPGQYPQRPPQQCFRNSFQLATEDPSVRYFEGVYMIAGSAKTHAWCVDASGEVIEHTFETVYRPGMYIASDDKRSAVPWISPEHWAYCGVHIEASVVANFYAKHHAPYGSASLLDRFGEFGEHSFGRDEGPLPRPHDPFRAL